MPVVASQPPRTGGCFKCGKTGHLARDCTAPQSEWIKRDRPPTQQQNASQAAPTANPDENMPNADNADAAAGVTAAAAAKQKRVRPKVTIELLKESSGMPDIYHNFPKVLQQQCKGKGHEVNDLRRMLEMFKRWQDRIFPYKEFDTFIADVEKMSGTNIVKHEMHQMRMNVVKVAQDFMTTDDAVMEEGEGEPAAAAAGGAGVLGDDELTLEDQELLDMVGADMEPAPAPTTGNAADQQQQQADGGMMDEEEELLALLQEQDDADDSAVGVNNAGGVDQTAAAMVTGEGEEENNDEEELLALLEEEDNAALVGGTQAEPVAVLQVPPAGNVEMNSQEELNNEEELLALLEENDNEITATLEI